MSISQSGWYVQNFVDDLDASQLAINMVLTTHKVALLSNSATPNFDTDVTWNNTNEVSGTNWATGGVALSAAAAGGTSTVPTLTISPAGTIMWDMGDISVATTTLTNARAARFYADALTTPTADALLLLINFGADYSTTAGTFGIQFAATGVGTLDLA